ncbi:hypothetical protein [Methylacidimicrobium tartarophylax]|uniref:Uncharacterized protein n=1 Tax=Methylacidimicrobium tartarophylax TaxID=1041768 RepID=A0A5E6MA96_9BACT|nr:hypothetical protein [Methylacidimicrobium tartarophylax]VVM05233.1 hypothetical protein MAMT_00531 [Methylacidimicrobium tartarophylax]
MRKLAAAALAFLIVIPASFASAHVMNTTKGVRLTILPVMGAKREEEPIPKGKVRVSPVAVNKATPSRQIAHGAKDTKTRQTSVRHKSPKPSARNKG